MEPFSFIYHNTSPGNKEAIVGSEKLLNGTYFCCTLYNGDLPTISPYGNERIIIPVDDVLKLFKVPTLYRFNSYACGANKYIEYMLAEGDIQPNPAMQNVDPVSNNVLHIGNHDGKPIREVRRNVGGYWVSLIVQKEIDLTQVQHEWVQM